MRCDVALTRRAQENSPPAWQFAPTNREEPEHNDVFLFPQLIDAMQEAIGIRLTNRLSVSVHKTCGSHVDNPVDSARIFLFHAPAGRLPIS